LLTQAARARGQIDLYPLSPIACNPLPLRQRKPGSVGVPADLVVAIMDEQGVLLPG
jgi:hypothetical protein